MAVNSTERGKSSDLDQNFAKVCRVLEETDCSALRFSFGFSSVLITMLVLELNRP